jgi:hypothetical protein
VNVEMDLSASNSKVLQSKNKSMTEYGELVKTYLINSNHIFFYASEVTYA